MKQYVAVLLEFFSFLLILKAVWKFEQLEHMTGQVIIHLSLFGQL